MEQIRNHKIDTLRALAIMCVFWAHAGAVGPGISSIRSFDVILLIFISAFMQKPDKISSANDYKQMLFRRFKKILIPTYITITLVLLLSYILGLLLHREPVFSYIQSINSYLLCENSIGYVWVMKLFLLNAVLAPVFYWFNKKCKQDSIYVLFLVMQLIIYMLIRKYYLQSSYNYFSWLFIHEGLLCCGAYALIGQEAMRLNMRPNWLYKSIIFWGIIFLLSQYGAVFNPYIGKRPPNLYYLSYGLIFTYLLYLFIPNRTTRWLEWISRNSLYLYFIHIFIVMGIKVVNKNMPTFLTWCILLLSSSLVLFVWQEIKKKWLKLN